MEQGLNVCVCEGAGCVSICFTPWYVRCMCSYTSYVTSPQSQSEKAGEPSADLAGNPSPTLPPHLYHRLSAVRPALAGKGPMTLPDKTPQTQLESCQTTQSSARRSPSNHPRWVTIWNIKQPRPGNQTQQHLALMRQTLKPHRETLTSHLARP